MTLWILALPAALLALPAAILAQSFTTTCANNGCVITVISGTVTVGPPPVTPPTISGFSPSTGPTTGGTAITITGTNFTGATRVAIAGTGAANYTVTSPTQINAITAAGTGTGVVAVTTPAGSGSSTGTFTYVSLPPPPGQPISDDFNESTLNAKLWTFLNPVGDGTQSMTGTQLKLVAPGGKNHDPAFGGANNSVRVRQPVANQDFSVLTRFDSVPTAQYQFEGLIVEQDGANYLRLQFGSTGTALTCNVDIISGGLDASGPSATITPTGTSLWMGVTKAGNVWTLYYSLDGLAYVRVGSVTQALNMSAIGPFVGNYNATSAPVFTGLVNSFVNAPIPTPPPVACNSTVAPGGNVQAAINAAATGSTFCFADGTFSLASSTTFKPGISYKAIGTPVLQGAGGYAVAKVQGNDTSISGLTMAGGGIEITGAADNLNVSGNIIRDISFNGGGGPAVSGIYQDPIIGAIITHSKFDSNQLRNIFTDGQMTCNGQFPPGGGQPCDYPQTGVTFFSLADTALTNNVFDSISGDAVHFLEAISCGETGGPKVPQPNITFSNNRANNTHRIPWEFQLCGTTNFIADGNVIMKMYYPNAWTIPFSFASEGTGARITNNYIDAASTQGPSWSLAAACFEIGATGTVVDGNKCTGAMGSSGLPYTNGLGVVMGSGPAFSNNQMCGPGFTPLIIFEPPCTTGATCAPWTNTNNTVAANCSGFPPPPVLP